MVSSHHLDALRKRRQRILSLWDHTYSIMLVVAFTQGGVNQHHLLSWLRHGQRHPRLDGPMRAHQWHSPSSFSIVRIWRRVAQREFPGFPRVSWLTCLIVLQLVLAMLEAVWAKRRSLVRSPSGRLAAWLKQQSPLWARCSGMLTRRGNERQRVGMPGLGSRLSTEWGGALCCVRKPVAAVYLLDLA